MEIKYNEKNRDITIGVAMSGGVDSSTVAYLLKKQGYNIFGVQMKTCKPEDEDAKKVCEDLGIPFHLYDATEEFGEKVMDYFVEEYTKGRTPNPCMVCNRHVKFGELLNFIKAKGADFMATGHYTRLIDGVLAIGDDPQKDQAYFLSGIKKENLKSLMFPLGDMEKTDVRKLAQELGVRVYAKKDSQEICFVDDGMLKEFLIEKSHGNVAKPGDIVDTKGKVLGRHEGLAFYTIGQRKGLGIFQETPLYVLELDAKNNRVIVGSNDELFKDELLADGLNIMSQEEAFESGKVDCFAKTRSRDKLHHCEVTVLENGEVKVKFLEDKVRAVTPGQGVVFYDRDGKVLGSAFIK